MADKIDFRVHIVLCDAYPDLTLMQSKCKYFKSNGIGSCDRLSKEYLWPQCTKKDNDETGDAS